MLVSTTTTFSRERTRASLISSGIEVSKTLESRRRLILANECVGAVGTNPTVNCESWAVSMMVVELCEEAFYRAPRTMTFGYLPDIMATCLRRNLVLHG